MGRLTYPSTTEPVPQDVQVVNTPDVNIASQDADIDVNVTNATLDIGNLPATQDVDIVAQSVGDLDVNITNSTIPVQVIEDMAGRDAFSRLRVSNPTSLFDAQFTYNFQPLIFERVVNGSGAAITHNSTNRNVDMAFVSTPTGGKAYMQSYEHFRYQPFKSQLIAITFNFNGGVNDVIKFVGYSDGNNGIELAMNGTTATVRILSATSNGNQTIAQANWNIDNFDGFGPSGYTLDFTKSQILIIDLQALYVGEVRIGFDIGGGIYYAHKFNHANSVTYPYIQTANLPVRVGMTCSATVNATMTFTCSAVLSEGGIENQIGFNHSAEGTKAVGSGTREHILSVRPKTTFNSITNRITFKLESIEVLVTGANPVKWELVLGQAISGTTTFNDVNATYSGFEYNTAGTISGSPTIVLASGYASASATVKSSTAREISLRSPITLDEAGAVRSLGTLSLLGTGIGGTSTAYGVLNWKELR